MRQTFKENIVRVVAVLGLVAVLLLGAWGIIQLAFIIPSFFGNLGGAFNRPATETLAVQTPSTVATGHAFPITWNHTGGDGAYSFVISYACANGLSMAAPLPTGSYQAVACNTPFNYIQATSSMPVVALVQGTAPVTATITVSATQLSSGSVTKTASAKVSVTPPATTKKPATTAVAAPAQTPSRSAGVYQASGRTTNLYGSPDLAVTILYAVPNYNTGRTSVQFVVQNVGTNVADYGWSFDATIPYNGGYPYNSGPQQKLYPGDKIVYTLGYQNDYNQGYYPYNGPVYPGACLSYNTPGCYGSGYGYGYPNYQPYYNNQYGYQGGHTITIQVDPYNQVYEGNEGNNTASASY